MNDLIPALAVTVVPVLLLAPVAWALRSQGGRHAANLLVPIHLTDWSPYDARVRAALAYYADKTREPFGRAAAEQRQAVTA